TPLRRASKRPRQRQRRDILPPFRRHKCSLFVQLARRTVARGHRSHPKTRGGKPLTHRPLSQNS
ncbi:MAG: hypothetical protein ACK55I_11660, partial [bacterium]